MKTVLLKRSKRDFLLFIFGINSSLRITDILQLKVGDILGQTEIKVRERKTNKEKLFPINQSITNAFNIYLSMLPKFSLDDYIFKSRQGDKPISRIQAYHIIKSAADQCKLKYISPHSMRKTFGYQARVKNHVSEDLLREIFNHNKTSTTRRYLGLTQDEKNKVYIDINL